MLLLVYARGHFADTKADVVFNASNINSLHSRSVVSSGQDSDWVKHLGDSASLDVCKSLCQAYAGKGAPCRSFTRYGDQHPNASLKGKCYGHVDRVWLPLHVPFIDSGILNRSCETGLDCSLNGKCDSAGKCVCGPGWQGSRARGRGDREREGR